MEFGPVVVMKINREEGDLPIMSQVWDGPINIEQWLGRFIIV